MKRLLAVAGLFSVAWGCAPLIGLDGSYEDADDVTLAGLGEYCEQALVICERAAQCCGAGFHADGCEAVVRQDCHSLARRVLAGSLTYRPDSLAECHTALSQIPCGVPTGERPAYLFGLRTCQYLFQGTAQPGEPCSDDEDCADAYLGPAVECVDTGKGLHCRRHSPVKSGDPCDVASPDVTAPRSCVSEQACHPVSGGTGQCKPQRSNGQSCVGGVVAECAEGYCSQSTCTPHAAEGTACDASDAEKCAGGCEAGACLGPTMPLARYCGA